MKAIYRHLYGAVPVSEYPSDLLQGEKRGECCFWTRQRTKPGRGSRVDSWNKAGKVRRKWAFPQSTGNTKVSKWLYTPQLVSEKQGEMFPAVHTTVSGFKSSSHNYKGLWHCIDNFIRYLHHNLVITPWLLLWIPFPLPQNWIRHLLFTFSLCTLNNLFMCCMSLRLPGWSFQAWRIRGPQEQTGPW